MGAPWTKMRDDLPDDIRVCRMARAVGLDADAVIGKLFRLWSWARTNAPDGRVDGLDASWLDAKVGRPGFAAAMEDVGWLVRTASGLALPKIEKYNRNAKKARSNEMAAERMRRMRAKKKGADGCAVTHPVTRNIPVTVTENVAPIRERERDRGMNSPMTLSCPEPAPPTSGQAPPREDAPDETPRPKRPKKPDPLAFGPAVLAFPVVGGRRSPGDQAGWLLTQARIDALAAAYPGVDALAECRKALAWCEANPTRRKTAGGMPEFLRRWIDKAQDRAAGPPARASPARQPLTDDMIERAFSEGRG